LRKHGALFHCFVAGLLVLSLQRDVLYSNAKRGIAIACRLSVSLSVSDIGGSEAHRLEILETNCTDN